MSGVRVLVGTRKGAFVLTSDAKRSKWDVSGPHFGGWEIYHMKGSPADPNRLYASQSTGWFGQLMQRSNDGGKTWEPVGNKFAYDGETGTHQWYDGTPHPWEFKRVWHLEPSLTDPDTVYAGVEDAALFRTTDGGQTWHELPGLRTHGTGSSWAPGAGGLCLHTIVLDPDQRRSHLRRHLGRRRVSHRRRRHRRGGPSTVGCDPRASRTRRPRSATACTGSPGTRRTRACCSCRSTGTSCAATTAATRGARSAGTCPPTSASSSTCTRTSRRPSTSCRSRATRNTIRPTASCACIAAGPAGRSGRRSPRACRSATATSTCCATRCRWTRSTRAACTSAPPAGRCTRRPMPATPGRRSSATFRPSCRSRSQTLR